MVELDNETLRKLQMTELELLKVVDNLCRKNKINYSLDGGTLLGAVRHKGFIPWDDDADVMMSRKEYDRFFEVCKTQLNLEQYFLQEFRTDEQYRWGYSKLRKNGTVFLREGQEHIKCHTGVCIDIFVFDNVPIGYLNQRLSLLKCFLIRKGLYSVVGKKSSEKLFLRFYYFLMSFFPREFWVKKLNKLIQNNNSKPAQLMSHLTYPNPPKVRYGLSKHYFDEYIEMEFEKCTFMVIKNYDKYLTELFGDYMKLPSKDKQKTHPVSKIEL